MSTPTEALSRGFNLALKHAALFIPALIPAVLSIALDLLVFAVWITVPTVPGMGPHLMAYYSATVLVSFITSIAGFIATFVEVDMANDAVTQGTVNLGKSFGTFTRRIGDAFVAILISAILAVTIILIPVAFFILVAVIVDGVSAVEGTKRAFRFVMDNLGGVIVFLIIVVGVNIVCGFIPYVGGIITWVFSVVVTTSTVVFYIHRKTPAVPLAPTPPPPGKKYCVKCGAAMPVEATFCPQCGAAQ